jgi:undecaprenyl-diphosphatase
MIYDLWHKIRHMDAAALYLFGSALILVVMLLGFTELADDVMEGDTQRIDAAILTLFRREENPGMPLGPDWLLVAARDITALGGHTVLILVALIAAGYTLMMRLFATMLLIVAASAGGMLLSALLKWAFQRARPDVVPHLVEVSTMSFPSGHAMLSAALYLSIGAIIAQLTPHHRQRLSILGIALLLTGLIGLSRVYLGVHYPTDVLAGWAAGLAWAIVCWLAMVYLQRQRN